MKAIGYLFAFTMLFISLVSCSTLEDDIFIENPTDELNLVKIMETNNHSIELYKSDVDFIIGYNDVYIRIKDKATNNYISNPEISWMPVMHMINMIHSYPKSELSLTEDVTLAKGFLIFQMPGNADEYWDLKLMYKIQGEFFEVTERIEVLAPADGMHTVSSFMGSDDTKYILAMVYPNVPEVKVNDFTAALYRMDNMMTFSVVEDYIVTLDPRMPGMGNHSSPNNKDLIFNATSKMYDGKLSLTMTGYWRVNMKLLNINGDVLKGEDITEENPESSLYFDF